MDVFTHQVAAVFCMKLRHGRHLELWRHVSNYPSPTTDAYSLGEQTILSPRSDLKRRSLGLFEDVAPTRTTTRTRWL